MKHRAEAVKAYLSSHGINGDLLTASGQGPDRPVASNDTAEGRQRNRRVEVVIGDGRGGISPRIASYSAPVR